MTQDNRRTTFRTHRAERRTGLLRYGRKRIPVQVLNESAGGFCVSAETSVELVSETAAELILDDGDVWRVKVKYVDLWELTIRIGLERVGSQSIDRRRGTSGELRPFSSLGALTITVSVFLGYVIGNNLPMHRWMRHAPSAAVSARPPHAPTTAP